MKSTTELLYFYGQLNSKASSEWSSEEIETVEQKNEQNIRMNEKKPPTIINFKYFV